MPQPIRMGRRVAPRTPVQAMKTYRVASPVATHTRPATCAEVGCVDHRRGWDSVVPVVAPAQDSDVFTEATILAAAGGLFDGITRAYLRCAGPAHESCPDDGPGMVRLHFQPGQPCFRQSAHRVSLERPEVYTVRAGDWRRDLGPIRRHTRPEHWVEDFQENQTAVIRQING